MRWRAVFLLVGLALAGCDSGPEKSRGGYDIPPDSTLDRIEGKLLAGSKALLQTMRDHGDRLETSRTVYVTFYGEREDLEALAHDPIFAGYRETRVTRVEQDPSGRSRYPYAMNALTTAVPSMEFSRSIERPMLEKAFHYDVLYDGWGADFVKGNN